MDNLAKHISTKGRLRLFLAIYSRKTRIESASKLCFFLELKKRLNSIPKHKFPLEFRIETDEESGCEICSFYTREANVPIMNLTIERNNNDVIIDIVPF